NQNALPAVSTIVSSRTSNGEKPIPTPSSTYATTIGHANAESIEAATLSAPVSVGVGSTACVAVSHKPSGDDDPSAAEKGGTTASASARGLMGITPDVGGLEPEAGPEGGLRR